MKKTIGILSVLTLSAGTLFMTSSNNVANRSVTSVYGESLEIANQGYNLTDSYVRAYRTSINGQHDLELKPIQVYETTQPITGPVIKIDKNKTYQTMLGVGGSFTDAAVYNMNRTTPEIRKQIYDLYFGKNGSQYTLTRVSVGSADFSTKFYDYNHDWSLADDQNGKASRDNTTPDPGALEPTFKSLQWFDFSKGRDVDHIIPAIKKANEYVSQYSDAANLHKQGKITVFAAPWSAPAWMKGGGTRPGGTALGGLWQITAPGEYNKHRIQPKYYPAYADYLVKYLQSMKAHGIDIYSLSLNNEAQNHPAWEMGLWTPEAAVDFISNHLGPALVKAGFKPKEVKGGIKLLVWDWDRTDFGHADGFKKWNNEVLKHPEALKYIDGIAFHWYGGLGNAGTSWGRAFDRMTKMTQDWGVEMYATEACQENGPVMNEWFPARRYIFDMINTFNHGSRTWIDWNLVLDESGGPTHEVENRCHAPLHIDTQGDQDPSNDKLIINPAYYVLKRMSRTVRPGSVRIDTKGLFTNYEDGNFYHTAFLQPDGKTISLMVGSVPNAGKNETGQSIKAKVQIGTKVFQIDVPKDSFTVYELKLS